MIVAVAYKDGEVFQHFGHTEKFNLYEIEDNQIQVITTVSVNGTAHGALANTLKNCNADTLICGGIGAGAQRALAENDIKLYGGVTGNADQAVKDLLAGTLQYNPDVKCNHHHHGEGEGHTCGGHHHHGKGEKHACGGHHHHHGKGQEHAAE